MADDPSPPSAHDLPESSQSAEDWGKEWEAETFKADEYQFSPEEGGNPTLFSGTSAGFDQYQATSLDHEIAPQDLEGLENLPSLDADPANETPAERSEGAPHPISHQGIAFSRMLAAKLSGWRKPGPRLPIVAALLLLLCLGVSLFFLLRPAKEQVANGNLPATAASEQESGAPPAEPSLPMVDSEPIAIAITPSLAKEKLKLDSFFIPVSQEPGDGINFLKIDLTLLLRDRPGEDLTPAKLRFVRDSVYQFYVNTPYQELRNYTLARRDMGQALLHWIEKQWPDGRVESIVFDHYEII